MDGGTNNAVVCILGLCFQKCGMLTCSNYDLVLFTEDLDVIQTIVIRVRSMKTYGSLSPRLRL
jgi:hypothetical protein